MGVEGIVTALHNIPNGEIWTREAILEIKQHIEKYGLKWSVAESLPVSESIKYAGDDRDRLIDNYCISLENLAKAGVKTVCYNFMPVIDWIRTYLFHENTDGSFTLLFDKIRFAYFDCYILKREGAENDYTANEMSEVHLLHKSITKDEIEKLIDVIIVKTQGFISGNLNKDESNPVNHFSALLQHYKGIDKATMRENLKYFLKRIIPTARKFEINMCIHPDDPPFGVLGLPRILSNHDDIQYLLDCVDDPHNGLTFCAGSLSAGQQNDVSALARKFAGRSHFVHLRSTNVTTNGSFVEAPHTAGKANLIEVVRIFETLNPDVPMRIDHGKLFTADLNKGYNPGYSFLGRMYAMAQISGIMAVVHDELMINDN